ncbi:putative disease resistance RPP13-like protein 1 [Telopea speciosissima]|uniref:putative disease resistance RPP13-like protein 1 n=1 Tax=Telopea speciosissima TaxID=54955 RepID=UPI001CC471FF|nr:putative disease resistance RPP13-like protein 1 [Telopea speciosissima]
MSSSVGQQFGWSSFLQGALDRFYSPELLDFIRRRKIDLKQVESLKRTSAKIQTLSDEAEVKQFTRDAVRLWLDPTATGTHLYNIAEELQGIKRFGSKVKDVNERLKSEVQDGVALGLMVSSFGSGSSKPKVFSERLPTSSLVNSSNVFGREEDKWEIVKWLLHDKTPRRPSCDKDDNFLVLPIVGMGGAGKTTHAQLIYNHETIEKHFDLKAWVCVSEDFDVVRLTKEILESATNGSSALSSNSPDVLQVKLQQTLSNKRFLLVLDDMWNEDNERWEALRTPFASGKSGSKMLVTTRNKGVSSIVRTPVEKDHDLKGLSDDVCFAIVRKHAFVDGNSCVQIESWNYLDKKL